MDDAVLLFVSDRMRVDCISGEYSGRLMMLNEMDGRLSLCTQFLLGQSRLEMLSGPHSKPVNLVFSAPGRVLCAILMVVLAQVKRAVANIWQWQE